MVGSKGTLSFGQWTPRLENSDGNSFKEESCFFDSLRRVLSANILELCQVGGDTVFVKILVLKFGVWTFSSYSLSLPKI